MHDWSPLDGKVFYKITYFKGATAYMETFIIESDMTLHGFQSLVYRRVFALRDEAGVGMVRLFEGRATWTERLNQ